MWRESTFPPTVKRGCVHPDGVHMTTWRVKPKCLAFNFTCRPVRWDWIIKKTHDIIKLTDEFAHKSSIKPPCWKQCGPDAITTTVEGMTHAREDQHWDSNFFGKYSYDKVKITIVLNVGCVCFCFCFLKQFAIVEQANKQILSGLLVLWPCITQNLQLPFLQEWGNCFQI